jgi:hypothetical protein
VGESHLEGSSVVWEIKINIRGMGHGHVKFIFMILYRVQVLSVVMATLRLPHHANVR